MRKQIGKNLKLLRNQNDFTQEEAAEKCNVSREALAKWERGLTLPSLDLVVKMAEIYGITVDELIFGKRENKVANTDNAIKDLSKKIEEMQEKILSVIDLKSKNYTLYEQYCVFYSAEKKCDVAEYDIPAEVYAQMGEDAAEQGNLIDAIKYYEEALVHGDIYVIDVLMSLHNDIIECYANDEKNNEYWSYRLTLANKMQQYGKIIEDEIKSRRSF